MLATYFLMNGAPDSPSLLSFSLDTETNDQQDEFSQVSFDTHDDNEDMPLLLPAASQQTTHRRSTTFGASDRTPLVGISQHQDDDDDVPSILFGRRNLDWNRNNDSSSSQKSKGMAEYLFGFMVEEPCPEDDLMASHQVDLKLWRNKLNLALFGGYLCTTAATTVPIALLPSLALELCETEMEASALVAKAASHAVLGTACGKFINGPVGDVFGARRVSIAYAIALSLSLLLLSLSRGEGATIAACFLVEFCHSVQWPCVIVILAAHYSHPRGPHQPRKGMYEGGLYVTSLASRCGSLLAIPLASLWLRTYPWRRVAQCGSLVALLGAGVVYWFVVDSPVRVHEPQNPIPPLALQEFQRRLRASTSLLRTTMAVVSLLGSVLSTNLVPSLKMLLKSGRFWIVAIAHTGSSMVRSSERILGTYFRDTSLGTLSGDRAGGLAVFLSLGTVLGLAIAGSIFTRRDAQLRKTMVARLYMATIGSCYVLALLALPRLRLAVNAPGLILAFQVMTTIVMGFGVAVQYSQIPGLVGATFGHNKGLYAAYTDGVACGLSFLVWKIVGDAVQEGNPEGGGWAYGWAAVALLVILCGVLMVEFMEFYFVRASKSTGQRQPSGLDTIIFV